MGVYGKWNMTTRYIEHSGNNHNISNSIYELWSTCLVSCSGCWIVCHLVSPDCTVCNVWLPINFVFLGGIIIDLVVRTILKYLEHILTVVFVTNSKCRATFISHMHSSQRCQPVRFNPILSDFRPKIRPYQFRKKNTN